MRYIVVVGDGMADLPVAELQGKTPLQACKTPNADRLASAGELGTCMTVPSGMPVGTETAFVGIMGYETRSTFTGRSPLEAAGMGIELLDNETAYRCNLVSLSQQKMACDCTMLSHSSYSIPGEDGRELMQWLIEQPRFKEKLEDFKMTLHVGTSFRHILSVSPERYKEANDGSMRFTPPHDIPNLQVRDYLPRGTMAYEFMDVYQIAYELLPQHPINVKRAEEGAQMANGIWLWGQGVKPSFQPWLHKFGIARGSVISAVPLVSGIGALVGLKQIAVEGATGELHTNYDGKADAAIKALRDGDEFVLVHVEAPDECSHDGDVYCKCEAIKRVDMMLGRILDAMDEWGEDYRLMFMSDHLTTVETRGHAKGAVPYLIYDSRKNANRRYEFNEEEAASTKIRVEEARMLIPKLIERNANETI